MTTPIDDRGWTAPDVPAEIPLDAPPGPERGASGGVLGAAGVAIARGDDRWPSDRVLAATDTESPLGRMGPVGVAGVLDGGFDLLRHGFGPMVGLAATLLLPLQLLDILIRLRVGLEDDLGGDVSPVVALGAFGGSSPWFWMASALRVFVLSFLGLTAGVMIADGLSGRRRRGPQLVRAAARRWWVAALLPLLCVPVKSASSCLLYVGFFFTDALLMCASTVAGAEGAGPLRAFARSWRLGWRSYGTALGVAVGGFVIASILQVALYLGPAALVGLFVASETALLVVQQVSLLVLLITQPLTACIAARAYVELRCRSEAVDLFVRGAELGLLP